MTARAVLDRAVRLGLLECRRGEYRFSFDLVSERCIVRYFPAVSELEAVLNNFDPFTYGEDFRDILRACFNYQFQTNRPFLGTYLSRVFHQLERFDPVMVRAFIRNVLEPMLSYEPDTALNFAAQIATVPYVLNDSQPEILLLETLKGVASWESLKPGVLAVLERMGDRPLSDRAMILVGEVLEAASSPNFGTYDPFFNLHEILDTVEGWLHSPHIALQRWALVSLGAVLKFEHRSHRSAPDNDMSINIRTYTLSLDDDRYRTLYTRARDMLGRLQGRFLELHAAEVTQTLAQAFEDFRLHTPAGSSDVHAEVAAWFNLLEAMLPRLGAMHAVRFKATIVWFKRVAVDQTRHQMIHLHRLLRTLPGWAQAELFLDPPDEFEFMDDIASENPDYERAQVKANRFALALAHRIVRTSSPKQLARFLEEADQLNTVEQPWRGVERIYQVDQKFGWAVVRTLLDSPNFQLRGIACLYAPLRWEPKKAYAAINALFKGGEAILLAALALVIVNGAEYHPPLARKLLLLAKHPSALVRSALLRNFWHVRFQNGNKARALRLLWMALGSARPDETVTAAATKALESIYGYNKPVPANVAKRFLECVRHVPFQHLLPHGQSRGIGGLTMELSSQQPLWLLQHLEERCLALPDADGFNLFSSSEFEQAFGEVVANPIDLPKCFAKLLSWLQPTVPWVLRSSAVGIFAALSRGRSDSGADFLKNAIPDADESVLAGVLSLVKMLPPSDRRTQVIESAVIRANRLGLNKEELESLYRLAIEKPLQLEGMWISGDGLQPPAPEDLAALEVAKTNLETATSKVRAGRHEFGVAQGFWRYAVKYIEGRMAQNNKWLTEAD